MQKTEIKNLLNIDSTTLEENKISSQMLMYFDDYITKSSEFISQESFDIYKKFVVMKQDAPESMKKNLFSAIQNYINEKTDNNNYIDALFLYRFLSVKSILQPSSLYNIGETLVKSGEKYIAPEFIKLYEQRETNLPLKFLTLANFYNLQLKDYKTAIKYYEKYIRIDETKSVIYTILASLYGKLYGDLSLKDQIHYFTKAHKLNHSDRLPIQGLAFCYEKLGDKINAKRFYEKLLQNTPTETDLYNYGAFLISCGDFRQGHKYFSHRFATNNINFKYPTTLDIDKKWNFKDDISQKTLLVHFEQGFGDTFMYCRFVPMLKKYAGKIIFIVQDSVYNLLKTSPLISNNIEILSDKTNLQEFKYDVHMALLDVPYVLNINTDTIPNTKGYLDIPEKIIKAYKKKYIKPNNKLKVGISYRGDKNANYNGRDIDFNRFKILLNLQEDIELYSLQADGENEDGFISLGSTFKNFTDTAAAIKNMDIIISTDNVILNLAGALGVKTFGLFNKHTNYRWYKLSNPDTGWYKSVIPMQVQENNCWSDVFSELINCLKKIILDKNIK